MDRNGLVTSVPYQTLVGLIIALFSPAVLPALQPAPPPDQFFDSNGVRIRYVEQGQGAPVVLIHGYTGNLERHWIAPGVFANLAQDHRVIALDCRGHGKSGKPTDPAAYGAEMSQDVVRLLDHLKLPRAHIVGFSLGAIILGPLLTTNADRFISATFAGHHPEWKWTEKDAQEAEAAAKELEGDTPFRSLIVGISPPNTPPPSDDEVRKLAQGLVAANDLKALAAFQRGRRPLVVNEVQLAAVRVPALEIIGSLDPNLEGMKELKKILPSLETVVVEGATHGGERGVLRRLEFLAALREFLARKR
jgi:pimeloyl-ACP methyl ester carboxylesterase